VCAQNKAAILIDFFTSLSEASMAITRIVIFFTPVGVLFLVLPRIVEVDNVEEMLQSVGLYTATIMTGLLVHGFIVLPIVYLILVRRNPYTHIAKMSSALLTAFGTSSSSATLPVTINCLEERVGLDPKIVRFLVPIGATVNMDGTALYEAVAAIFIAQSRGLDLSPINVIIISITATFASIGAAGIPQAGLVTMVIVLNAVGLPAEDVYLIFVVDWFLDRFRTVINVLGDSFGAAVISHICPKTDFLDTTDTEFSYDFPSRNSSTKKKEDDSIVDLTSMGSDACNKCIDANGIAVTQAAAVSGDAGNGIICNGIRVLDKSPKLSPRGIRETKH
jgi:Na+/H+-dicarboxylate symporter